MSADLDKWLYGEVETGIEDRVVKFAKDAGWWVKKFTCPGSSGEPDRIFIRDGVVLFIEFKKKGQTLRDLQRRRHKEMQSFGALVYWFDNEKEAYEVLR